jgi:hypothetical protein
MPRVTALIALLAVLGAALYVVLKRNDLAFTPGVTPAIVVANLERGDEVCQRPLTVPPDAAFDRVRASVTGPAELVVRAADSGRVLRRAPLRDGVAQVQRVPAGTVMSVCIANPGSGRVRVTGNSDQAARLTGAALNGNAIPADLTLRFERDRSLASLLPAMADRASLFKAGWVGPAAIWILAALVLLAVPVALVRAVRAAGE